jgi:DNA uptake protein ComE-like DNA-binding protein
MKRKKIKTGWLEYFNFSTRERRGAIFLAVILSVQIVVLFILKNVSREVQPPDEKIMQALILASASDNVNEGLAGDTSVESSEAVLQPFNPNEITDTSMHVPGLSKKQIKVINHYLSRGGKFRIKNDFRKMYCIKEAEFNTLKPYIQLPDTFENRKKENKKSVDKPSIVDIGSIDSTGLLVIRGIGPVFASRIVKFRDKLGGFYSLEQLKEVWGITDSMYQNLLPSITLNDTIPFRYINLNTDSFALLASHPYVKGKIAGLICKFRKHHPFKSVEELKQLPLITDENFRKLAPYIKTE